MITQFEFAHIFSNDQPRLEVGTGFYPRNQGSHRSLLLGFFQGEVSKEVGGPSAFLSGSLNAPLTLLDNSQKKSQGRPLRFPKEFL